MKTPIQSAVILLAISGAARAAPFENLNFELAHTNTVTPSLLPTAPGQGTGPVTDLLPGWQLLRDGQPITTMDYNNSGTFEQRDFLSVIGPEITALFPFEGRYYVSFFPTGPWSIRFDTTSRNSCECATALFPVPSRAIHRQRQWSGRLAIPPSFYRLHSTHRVCGCIHVCRPDG